MAIKSNPNIKRQSTLTSKGVSDPIWGDPTPRVRSEFSDGVEPAPPVCEMN
jgi:hypothetical protein